MLTYSSLRRSRREFLALTGLTPREFRLLLAGFTAAYGRRYRPERTVAGGTRLRRAGGGRKAVLGGPEQRLVFILVYLKAYPLQALMGELFGMSQSAANRWVHRLLPVLRDALGRLGVGPERDPARFARGTAAARLIIDGTERRRQRPKSPEKQALHYSGKKKTHTDKNVLVADARRGRVGFLGRTFPGKAHDKAIADHEAVAYPPRTELYQDSGFQGYEPKGATTRRPKKKAARPGADGRREAGEPETGPGPGRRGTRHRRRQTLPRRQGHPAEHQGGILRRGHGGRDRAP